MNRKIQSIAMLAITILTLHCCSANDFCSTVKDKAQRTFKFTMPKLSGSPEQTYQGKIKVKPTGLFAGLKHNPGKGYVEIPGKHYITKKENGKKTHFYYPFPICKWPKNLNAEQLYKIKRIGFKLYRKSVSPTHKDNIKLIGIQKEKLNDFPVSLLPHLIPVNNKEIYYLKQTTQENDTEKQMLCAEKSITIYPKKTERLFNKYGAGW